MAMLSVAIALLCVTVAAASPIPDWMMEAEKRRGSSINMQDWVDLQNLYNPGAEILPEHTLQFVMGNSSGAFYKGLYDSGLTRVLCTPQLAVRETATLWHEIGLMNSSKGVQTYYIRWIKPEEQNWQIAFDAMAIGMPAGIRVLPVAQDAPPAWMQSKASALGKALDTQNYTGAAAFYNPGALAIPPHADRFLSQPQLALFFEKLGNSAKGLSLTPKYAYSESPTLVHEIGSVGWSLGHGTYYTRWVNVGGDWQIAFQIMIVV